jgi:hypothetical protein
MGESQPIDEQYTQRAEDAFRQLFELAKSKNEVQFALSLAPEFRGEQGPGWSAREETDRAFEEYLRFLEEGETTSFKIRVALSFYCHLSEASGFYEALKNLLRIAGSEDYRMWPFLELNRQHADSGRMIAPNSNKIFKDLIGHANSLGLTSVTEVLRDAFDSKIRNAYAHADYIIWSDGFRIRNQACGRPEVIPWETFNRNIHRGLNFYQVFRALCEEYILSYRTARIVRASMGNGQHEMEWKIELTEEGGFTISGSSP